MEEKGKEIDKLSNALTALRGELWREHTLFTWQWWLLVGICVAFVAAGIFLLRKKGLLRAFAYYGVLYVLNRNLDDLATALDWYDYRMQLEPVIPTLLPANLFGVPIPLMILYQRLPTWKQFSIGLAVFAGFVSFVALPLMEWTGIYLLKEWNAFWSFLSLFVMGAAAKLIVDALWRFDSEVSRSPDERRVGGGKLGFAGKLDE
ncbi:hypothetical protein MO973_43445 [Paenibacillus sp. TRM 82003]|nr:hypothetical protein [Paenibacillus sp. TRM 82003]